jgi:hypothetical protein
LLIGLMGKVCKDYDVRIVLARRDFQIIEQTASR